MKNNYLLYGLIFFFGWLAITAHAKVLPPPGIQITPCALENLNKLEVSYGGQSVKGNKYNLYAIKDKKSWIFLVVDTTGLHSLTYPNKHKSDTLVNNSPLFTDGFCKIVEAGLLKKVEKRKNVADLTLFCYYQLKKNGQKISKSLTYLEAKEQEQVTFFKKISKVFAPIAKLFKSKKK